MILRLVIPSAFVVTSLAVGPARGQGEKTTPPNAKFPTAGRRQLDRLAGTWDVTISFKIGPGMTSEGTATCVAKWILDGKALQQDYFSKFNGRPFTAMQWLGYDANKKKFFEIEMDSMDTGAMHNEGSLSEDGKTLTQVGQRVDPGTGKSGRIRTYWTSPTPIITCSSGTCRARTARRRRRSPSSIRERTDPKLPGSRPCRRMRPGGGLCAEP
jgi:hypothetical protein